MDLKDSETLQNLKDAFAGESQANRRYLYFAAKADVEGENDVAAVFRSTAEGETGHAHGHLEYMEAVGDPATGLPMGNTADNLRASVAGETTSTLTCTRAWLKQREMKALRKSQIGSKPWRKPSGLTLTDSKKLSTQWAKPHCDATDERGCNQPLFYWKDKDSHH